MTGHDEAALCWKGSLGDNALVTKDWLRQGLQKPGKTQAGLAKALRVDPSVISKMVNGTRRIKADELPVIAAYLGEQPPIVPGALSKFPATFIKRYGKVAAGVWREADATLGEEMEAVAIARDDRYPTLEQYALLVEGNSVNKVAQDGDYVICVPYWEVRRAIQDGDLVHVERKRGGLVEGTLKRVRVSNSGFELHPESTDPRHQSPLKYDDKPDVEQVEICGLVIGRYQAL